MSIWRVPLNILNLPSEMSIKGSFGNIVESFRLKTFGTRVKSIGFHTPPPWLSSVLAESRWHVKITYLSTSMDSVLFTPIERPVSVIAMVKYPENKLSCKSVFNLQLILSMFWYYIDCYHSQTECAGEITI